MINQSVSSFYFILYRALLPSLAEDLIHKAIDPIFPADIGEDACDSCQSEDKMTENPKQFFMII